MHIQPFPPNKFSKRQSKRQRGQPSCKRLSLVPAACAFALCTCTCTIQPTPDPAGIRLSASNGGTRAPVSQSADHSTSTHPSTIARSGSGTGLTDHRRSSTQIPFWGRISWGRQENKNRQHELPGVSRLLLILSRRPISRTAHHDTIASPYPSLFHLWTSSRHRQPRRHPALLLLLLPSPSRTKQGTARSESRSAQF